VSAAIKVFGPEGGVTGSGLTMAEWTEVAGHWTQTMAADMMRYAGHTNAILQEEGRLRAGGQPRKVQVTRVQGQIPAAPAPGGNPYAAAMGVPAGAPVAAYGNPMQQAMAAAQANPAYQQSLQNQAAIAQNPIGFGFGQAAA